MSKIKIMDELLSNKIAAGEVVEKCVSIVKELVENSIDAKSTEIRIELKESGIDEVKVIDNGIGMDEYDAVMAFGRHATSKLLDEDNLFNIDTLGFRGEALPSIASVSEVVLKTCQNNIGYMVHIKGGKLINKGKCEARIGTSISVRNLFYNTPARLKHLSSLYNELASIIDYINKISLSYPHIKFLLSNDDKVIFTTDGSNNQLKVIKEIYGLDVTKKMIPITTSNNDYNVDGYISLPEITRANRNHMITLVNGRVIRNTELNKTINDSYHNYKEDSRYPIVVLNIKCDPSLIDVNIHPSKLDIKFSNFEDLKTIIKDQIINTLKKRLLIVNIKNEPKEELKYDNLSFNLERNIINDNEEMYNGVDEFLSFNQENIIKNENNIINTYESISSEEDENILPELYPVGLALGTYIICQNNLGIYLIDQHAAKERINYEKYKKSLGNPNVSSISLLIPIIIELSLNEFIIVKENLDFIKNMKIEIEEFGEKTFRILSHPTWFINGREKEIIERIIELISMKEKDFNIEKFNDRLAMSISCKMSIKANTDISLSEMENLLNDLRKCENPYNCPHGRPTIIHYSIYELEKLFKRSM